MGDHNRILVVDDDEGIRSCMKKILEGEGYIVDTAENGEEAIKRSNVNFYNLALIDIRLPDMEGIEVLTAMKETTPRMGKIILTGHPELENTFDEVYKGVDAYLLKPFNVEKFLEKIRELLQRQQIARNFGEEEMVNFIYP